MRLNSRTGDQANEQGPYSVAGEIYGYSYAEGEVSGAEGDPSSMEEQSYAGGVKRKTAPKKKKKKGVFGGKVDKFLADRQKNKVADQKNTASAVKAMGKSSSSLKLPTLPKSSKKPMNSGLKWGLIGGGALLLTIGGWLLYKKFGKHGK